MDIYSFIRSSDVAAYCREIGKTWNTYEMAVIIGVSGRPITEIHTAWRELIDNYPDMSVQLHAPFKRDLQIESIHNKLAEIMENERCASEPSEAPEPIIDFEWCYVDIPVPFKRGDILVSVDDEDKQADYCFVLESLDRNDGERFTRWINCRNYISEAWGFFVNDNRALYGDHVGRYESCVYYRGKLEGKDRLLHYVNLFMQGQIDLPELLNMQCRIIAEHMLMKNFHIDPHGCDIPEYLLAENRLNPDERRRLEETIR